MITLTGAGCVLLGPSEPSCDPTPFLRVRKSRKFMGLQDDLAVVAAGRALRQAGLSHGLGPRVGLYLAVGYIPFRHEDITPVLEASLDPEGSFDLGRFGHSGFQRAHPLLTFGCLPNMPAFHVSVNFDVQGPYFVTYPGPGQFYTALQEARDALESGLIDLALVGAVAHQNNFLVAHHFSRVVPPVAREALRDVAAMWVVETDASPRSPLARLESLEVSYAPADIAAPSQPFDSSQPDGELGPAGLALALAQATQTSGPSRHLHHTLRSRDGFCAKSNWSLS